MDTIPTGKAGISREEIRKLTQEVVDAIFTPVDPLTIEEYAEKCQENMKNNAEAHGCTFKFVEITVIDQSNAEIRASITLPRPLNNVIIKP